MKTVINCSKARRNGLNKTGLQSQKGIATILLVIMLAIAITATSLSMMHSVRSTQEKHEATHASTHAQSSDEMTSID